MYTHTTGEYNTAIGHSSLNKNETGEYNTAIGHQALYTNTTGGYNTSVGYEALLYNKTGVRNTSVGYEALRANTTGERNTAVGTAAGDDITTGSQNTAIGAYTYAGTTGMYNTSLGYGATCITAGSTGVFTLGDSNVTNLRCNDTSISALSDARDKADIENLTIGLDFIRALKPRIFKWDKREWYAKKDENDKTIRDEIGRFILEKEPDGSKKQDKWVANFIAQEVLEVQKKFNAEYLEIVTGTEHGYQYEMAPLRFYAPLVKAVQELADKLDVAYKEIEILKGNKKLKSK